MPGGLTNLVSSEAIGVACGPRDETGAFRNQDPGPKGRPN